MVWINNKKEHKMEKSYLSVPLFAIFLVITLVCCSNPDGQTAEPIAGDQQTFTADAVSFKLVYVPGKTFPTGTDDLGTPATVANAYWIGEAEVTYELWSVVNLWATDAGRGANIYYFQNAGTMGDGTGDTNQHPVTFVSWRDAIVWTNAVTEWYSAKTGVNYTCVFTYLGAIIRDSRDANANACDNAVASTTAKGFRLLYSNEWELAARWRNDSINSVAGYTNPWFTVGNSASGATINISNAAATQEVAWYTTNAGSSTHIVKTKASNALGLFDMSGNVQEWCFELDGVMRVARGGCWSYPASSLTVGLMDAGIPDANLDSISFRLAKTN